MTKFKAIVPGKKFDRKFATKTPPHASRVARLQNEIAPDFSLFDAKNGLKSAKKRSE